MRCSDQRPASVVLPLRPGEGPMDVTSSSQPSRSPSLAALRVLCLATLGRHGNPLFLESYSIRRGGQADLKWHYACHTALDFFDERGEKPGHHSTTDSVLTPNSTSITPQSCQRQRPQIHILVYSTRWKTTQCNMRILVPILRQTSQLITVYWPSTH